MLLAVVAQQPGHSHDNTKGNSNGSGPMLWSANYISDMTTHQVEEASSVLTESTCRSVTCLPSTNKRHGTGHHGHLQNVYFEWQVRHCPKRLRRIL
jgi:hypothetical protein